MIKDITLDNALLIRNYEDLTITVINYKDYNDICSDIYPSASLASDAEYMSLSSLGKLKEALRLRGNLILMDEFDAWDVHRAFLKIREVAQVMDLLSPGHWRNHQTNASATSDDRDSCDISDEWWKEPHVNDDAKH